MRNDAAHSVTLIHFYCLDSVTWHAPIPQFPNDAPPPTISCALYLASFGRLVCGQTDGCIAVLSASQAATVLMLQPRKFSQGLFVPARLLIHSMDSFASSCFRFAYACVALYPGFRGCPVYVANASLGRALCMGLMPV